MSYKLDMAVRKKPHLTRSLAVLIALLWLVWRLNQLPGVGLRPLPAQFGHESPSYSNSPSKQGNDIPPPPESSSLEQKLCHYGICDLATGEEIMYSRITIRVQQSPHVETALLENITIDLPALEPQNLTSTEFKATSLSMTTAIKTPMIPKVGDASNTLFGVATTIDRLEASLSQFSHWGSGNGARIVALVSDCAQTDIDRVLEQSHALALDLTIFTIDWSFDDRYFHLATLMYETCATPSTSWVAFIDDDTFFPNMASLQTMLSQYVSPTTKPYYVSSLSEDLYQLTKHGIIGYGGGGVFLSIALLKQIHPYLPSCVGLAEQGDARLAHCISVYTNTKLTTEPLLHQLDIAGDVIGFYEALRPQPLSIHHWKSWHRLDMVNVSKVSLICGDACIFQKYRFADDWQMTNGVSIVKYSAGHERGENDTRTEKTFDDSTSPSKIAFLHSLEPLRERDPGKIQFMLEGAVLEKGVVRQFYVKRGRRDENGRSMDVQIIEVAWMKEKRWSIFGS